MENQEKQGDIQKSHSITITEGDMQAAIEHLAKNPQYMLQLPLTSVVITKIHMQGIDATKDMSFFDENQSSFVHDCTMKHNYGNLLQLEAITRPWQLIWPLISIDFIRMNCKNLKVLSIGPRTEAEILAIYGMGIDPNNVTAIDLMSYSPAIDVGDMHDLPYKDNTFDIIIAGWVLAYSADNQKAADEMKRVSRPGCHIAIGCVAEPHTTEYKDEGILDLADTCAGGVAVTSPDPSYKGGTKTVSRFFNCRQILALFEEEIDQIIFQLEPHPSWLEQRSNVVTVFRLK